MFFIDVRVYQLIPPTKVPGMQLPHPVLLKNDLVPTHWDTSAMNIQRLGTLRDARNEGSSSSLVTLTKMR